jgi:hypothetical protein
MYLADDAGVVRCVVVVCGQIDPLQGKDPVSLTQNPLQVSMCCALPTSVPPSPLCVDACGGKWI